MSKSGQFVARQPMWAVILSSAQCEPGVKCTIYTACTRVLRMKPQNPGRIPAATANYQHGIRHLSGGFRHLGLVSIGTARRCPL